MEAQGNISGLVYSASSFGLIHIFKNTSWRVFRMARFSKKKQNIDGALNSSEYFDFFDVRYPKRYNLQIVELGFTSLKCCWKSCNCQWWMNEYWPRGHFVPTSKRVTLHVIFEMTHIATKTFRSLFESNFVSLWFYCISIIVLKITAHALIRKC